MAAHTPDRMTGHAYARSDLVLAAVKRIEVRQAKLVQLVREAREMFTDPESPLDLRDWVKAADAAIAKAEGR